MRSRALGVRQQAPLNHREQVACFAVNQVVETNRKRGQGGAGFDDFLVEAGDKRDRVDRLREMTQAQMLFVELSTDPPEAPEPPAPPA